MLKLHLPFWDTLVGLMLRGLQLKLYLRVWDILVERMWMDLQLNQRKSVGEEDSSGMRVVSAGILIGLSYIETTEKKTRLIWEGRELQ